MKRNINGHVINVLIFLALLFSGSVWQGFAVIAVIYWFIFGFIVLSASKFLKPASFEDRVYGLMILTTYLTGMLLFVSKSPGSTEYLGRGSIIIAIMKIEAGITGLLLCGSGLRLASYILDIFKYNELIKPKLYTPNFRIICSWKRYRLIKTGKKLYLIRNTGRRETVLMIFRTRFKDMTADELVEDLTNDRYNVSLGALKGTTVFYNEIESLRKEIL